MTRRTRALSALAAVTATAAAVLVVGPGYHAAQVRMRSGLVWLASNQTGEVVLLDGASAEVAAKVPVGEPGHALSVTQHGTSAVVVDGETGRLSRVDTASLRVSRSPAVLSTGSGLVVKPARDVIHGVDVHSGTVTSVDPGRLAQVGAPARLAETLRPGEVVADSRGRLWAIDDQTGDLVWLTGTERRTRPAAAKTGHLAITGDEPALVDPDRGTAELLSPETGAVTRSVRTGLRAGDAVAVGGSTDKSRLLIANQTRGELVACAFDAGSCAGPVRIGDPGAELGTPVEVDNHAVVPDYSTGRATIVDLGTSRVVASMELFPHPVRFELTAHDGIVVFNDPNSTTAGVLNLAGKVWTITKYAGKPSEDDTRIGPDQQAQAVQVTRTDHGKGRQDQGNPGRANPPVQRDLPPDVPASEASIVVSPRNRGVAGTEFELTLVLRSAHGDWDTRWRLGDGSDRTGATIRHTWHQQGVFTVQAIATFPSGAHVQAETTVTVDPPEAPPRITALTVRRPKPVIGESVRFSAAVTAQPETWRWTVSRPGSALPEVTADTAEFSHAFSAAGTYAVTLAITRGTRTATSSLEFTVAQGAVKRWGKMRMLPGWELPQSAGSGVVAIDAGKDHALALKSDGSVIAWGDDDAGQTDVPAEAEEGVTAIAAGAAHSLALKSDGSVIAWGSNEQRQSTVPSSAKHGVVAISATGFHNLALKSDGSVIAWGSNDYGETSVPQEARNIVAISAGFSHSLALRSDGSVVQWGDEDDAVKPPPEAMKGIVAIDAGVSHDLALKSDGSVIGWGRDTRTEVLDIPEEAMSGVVAISTFGHALALKSDGSLIGWGLSRPGASTIPPEYSANVLAFSAGGDFSVVLL